MLLKYGFDAKLLSKKDLSFLNEEQLIKFYAEPNVVFLESFGQSFNKSQSMNPLDIKDA